MTDDNVPFSIPEEWDADDLTALPAHEQWSLRADDAATAQDYPRAAYYASIATYELLREYRAMIETVSEAVTPAIDAISKSPVGRMLGMN